MAQALGSALRWVEASIAGARLANGVGPPHDAPVTVGTITLLPHQREAVRVCRAAIARWGGALLADPVGTGKTWVALGIAASYAHVHIIAPAALRTHWRSALTAAQRSATVQSFDDAWRRPAGPPRDALIVVDEAHHARNPATRRFDALATLAWGRDLLLLTATPIHNRAADLHALCSLFLGARAQHASAELLSRIVCRRLDAAPTHQPVVDPPDWCTPEDDADTLRAIHRLPPPVPPADGGSANALATLGLVRQWASSEAALCAALQRRLAIGLAMESRLMQGGTLTRADLRRWVIDTSTIQLGFPLDLATPGRDPGTLDDLATPGSALGMLEQLRGHLDAVRALRDRVRTHGSADRWRWQRLATIVAQAAPVRVVCFTHSRDTARAAFRALAQTVRCAVIAGTETRIASGRADRREILAQFTANCPLSAPEAMRVDVLISTDVMSEGVDLHDAGVLVHLDLPWTMARLEQRVGRLRRLGATHDRIRQPAFAPPGGAARFLRLSQRLARKAGVAARLVGADPIAALLHSRVGCAAAASPSDAAARLREVLRHWTVSADRPADALTAPVPIVAALDGDHTTTASVALVDAGEGPHLVVRSHGTISSDPGDVLARLAGCVPPDDREPQINDAVRREAGRHVAALDAWCRRRARHHELLGDGLGPVQRRAVRRLAQLGARVDRRTRRALAPHIVAATRLVQEASGVGVERWLDAWTRRAAPGVHAIAELHATLAARARPSATRSTPGVRCLLLLLPRRVATRGR
ncbi:MAG: DEAD/DEAH box helicase [Gemmatimonadaceae bacterium]|nr:DEAD/DEAH box helicase [Gemmatimonadaceae bacterium]